MFIQDSDKYTVSSETRSQLRVLETIDRVVSKRKQERENEQTLRAAKSRSKGTDPEKVAKLREEAKQVCNGEDREAREDILRDFGTF